MPSAFRTVHDWVVRDAARPILQPLRRELRRLPAGAVVGFAVEKQTRVTCLGGELWVTGPGTDDQILVSGESVSMTGAGRAVAEALRDARFVIVR